MGQKVNRLQRIFGRVRFWTRPRRIFSLVLSTVLVLNGPLGFLATARAQVVSDPRAPIQFQPRVGTAPNGVPLIDITKPSFGGLSHNRYERLNVDTRGIILNNSGLGGTSILGGQIPGNPNLVGSRPASVILNEVTGPSASLLNGPTEVFGSKAEVIIANQHGVTCRSCSFINTGRVTLSTGVPIPDYQNGTVAFEVRRGTVRIEGAGVAAINSEGQVGKIGALDLVGRQIEVDGRIISDNHVRMRSGAINWNQNSDVATRLSGTDIPIVSGPGISSTGNGLIEAGTISAISHDLNVGVSFAGDMTALGLEQPDGSGNTVQTAGLIVVSSQGDLAVGKSGSRGDIRLDAAGRLSFSGGQQATGRIAGFGHDIVTDGSMAANDAIVLEAVRNITTRAQLQSGSAISIVGGGDVAASGLISASGMLAVEGTNVSATDLQAAGRSVTVAGLGLVALDRTALVSETDISVLSRDVRLGQGTAFQAGENQSGRIFIDARGTLSNATVLNYPNLTLNLAGSLINEAGGELVFDNLHYVLSGDFVNAGLLYGRVSSLIEAETFENRDTGTVYGPDVVINVRQNLINAGKLLSDGNISVQALGAVLNSGEIKGNGPLVLKSASYTANSPAAVLAGASAELIVAGAFDNAGTVQGLNGVWLHAASLNNGSESTIYGSFVDMVLSGGALNNAGKVLSLERLSILNAGAVTNSGVMQSNGDVTLNAASYAGTGAGSVLEAASINATLSGAFSNDGLFKGVNGVTLQATSLNNSASAEIFGGFVDVRLSSGALENTGKILSLDRLSILDAGPMRNSGVMQANSDITLKGTSYNGARAGSRLIGDRLTLQFGNGAFSNDGQIIGRNGVNLTAGSLANNSGAVLYGTDVALVLIGDTSNAGEILSESNLTLSSSTVLNSGVIKANSALALNAASYSGLGSGSVLEASSINVSLPGIFANDGLVKSANGITLRSTGLNNSASAEIFGGFVDVGLSGGALDNAGNILSLGYLSIPDASTVNNSGAIQANGDITLTGISYAGTGADSRLTGNQLTLQFNNGAFGNDGQVIGRDKLMLTAGNLANAAGAILYGRHVTLALTGAFDNAGQVLGANGVAITGTSASNTATGTVYGSVVDLAFSGDVINAGSILSESGLVLAAGGAIINDGALQANISIRLTGTSYTANTATAVVGAGSVDLLVNGNVDNAGRILADDNLVLTASALTNRAGAQIGGYDMMLTLAGATDNAGKIEAQNLFNLSGTDLTNSGSITAYEISRASGAGAPAGLVLSGALDNRGVLQSTNSLILQAASLWNASDATIQGGLDVFANVAGDLNNSGVLLADRNMQLFAANLINGGTAASHAVISANQLEARIGNHFGNNAYGLVQGIASTVISASTSNLDLFHSNGIDQGVFNYGKDLALTLSGQGLDVAAGQKLVVDGSLYLSYGGDLNVFGTIASRDDLSLHSGGSVIIGRNDPSNPGGGEIFTFGNGEIIAANNITNYASLIQSIGDLYIEAGGTFTNTRTDQTKDSIGVYYPSRLAQKYIIWWKDPSKYMDEEFMIHETSQAAQVWSDGALVIKAKAVDNIVSQIVSGGDMLIVADKVRNLSRKAGLWITSTKISGDNVGSHPYDTWGDEPDSYWEETSAMIAGGSFTRPEGERFENTGIITGTVIRIDADTLINGITDPNVVTAPPRLPDPVIDLSNYFTAPGSGSVDGQTGNGVNAPGSGTITGGPGSGIHAPGAGSVTGKAGSGINTPGLGSISGPTATNVVVNGVKYKYGTPLPDESGARGPDWILEQVGDGRLPELSFFADPTTERRLIMQALIDQTGRSVLDPKYRNPKEQQEALWQGTVDFLKSNPDIKLGDRLTAAQRAKLSEPILWYEARIIDGETVLVPQLVLPENRLNEWVKSNGGVMAADDIFLSGDRIHNTGAILAESTLSIEANTFINERRVASEGTISGFAYNAIQDGGLLAGNIVQVKTTGDLFNIGGTIIGDSSVNLVSGGNLVLSASVVENELHDGSKKNSLDYYSRENYGGTVYSGGNLSLFASNDIVVSGSNVIALGNASLLAGNEITITSVKDELSIDRSGKKNNVISQSKWTMSYDSETNLSSTIAAGGNLTIGAAGDVNIHASHLVAGEDILVAAGAGANGKADANVNITTDQDVTSLEYSKTKSGLFGGGSGWADIWYKKSILTGDTDVTNVGSSLNAGGDVTITASQDINIQGSSVSAGGTAALDAGRDINITPGYNGTSDHYKKEEKGIGIGGSAHNGSAKAQAGYHSEKIELGLETQSVAPSVIQGGTGVSMNAGNDINLQAAIVQTPGDITLKAGHDINADVAYDTSSMIAKHDEKFFGVTAKVSQNVTGIISNLKSAADTFKSGHGSSAYEAIGMVSGVMKAMDAVSTAANGPRVSGSVMVGGEGKSTSMHEEMALAHGTALEAGGNLTISAGNDVHLKGTQATAGNDINISAGNNVIIESAQSYSSSGSKETNWSAGIGVGASAGLGGWSAGFQADGSYANSENDTWGIQQNNSHIVAGGAVNIKSGNDTTIAGAVIGGSEASLDVGNNLTVQSRQDTGHSDGSAIRAGGSVTVGGGFAVSGHGGGGSSDSDVAWVTEQTGIYSTGKMDIYVENHTQLDGSVINSKSGELTLDTGTLGFSTIKDHDRGSSFDMTVGGGYSTIQDTPYSWNTVQNGGSGAEVPKGDDKAQHDPKTGAPPGVTVSGSIENHDREQDTNATVGAGTIIIRNKDKQQQDVADLNRDLEQAQVITKDESSGVDFYASSSAIEGLTNPAQYATEVISGFERQMDQLAAMGNNTAARLREAMRNGSFDEETLKALVKCSSGTQSGFNLLDLFITPAHASGTCLVPIGGKMEVFPVEDAAACAEAAKRMMQEQEKVYYAKLDEQARQLGQYPTGQYKIDRWFGQDTILAGQGIPVMYGDVNTPFGPLAENYRGTTQFLYSNPRTGTLEVYNPYAPVQGVEQQAQWQAQQAKELAAVGQLPPGYTEYPSGIMSPMLGQRQGQVFNDLFFVVGGTGTVLGVVARAGAVVTVGGEAAKNVADAERLAAQLRLESAKSPFGTNGTLTQEAVKNAQPIPNLGPGNLANPNIPSGFGKYTTETFQGPSGPFQVHFYKNPSTGQVYYNIDYKAVFNSKSGIH